MATIEYDLDLIPLYIEGAIAQTIALSQSVTGDNAIQYDLTLLGYMEGAIAQTITATDAVDGELNVITEDGAVAQTIALSQAVHGLIPDIEYDLLLQTAIIDGAVSQSIALTQVADGTSWERIADLAADSISYSDTTALAGVTYEYRVVDYAGAVLGTWLYSNSATLDVERDAAVAEAVTLGQGVSGYIATNGGVAQVMALRQSVSGAAIGGAAVDGEVAHAIALVQALDGAGVFVYGAVGQHAILSQAVAGVSIHLDGAVAQSAGLSQVVAGVVSQGLPAESGAVAQIIALSCLADGASRAEYRRMTGTGDGATATLTGHGTSTRTLTGSGSSTPRL